jgi:hypothetical protein
MLLNHFDIAFDHAVWLQVQQSSSLSGVTKPPVADRTQSYGPGHYVAPAVLWSGRRSWWTVHLSLHKIVHNDHEVSVSFVDLWEGPCYINGYPFERGLNIVLTHLVPIPGSGAATDCTGVTLSATLLNIVSCLESVVPLLSLIQGLVDIQVTSWWPTM